MKLLLKFQVPQIMPKVLIITYYWPPAGGSGVQRWLKFTKYLPLFGYEPIVLTVKPEDAAYPFTDYSLSKDVSPEVKVYRTKSFNPISLGTKMLGKSSAPTAGFASGNSKKLSTRLTLWLRTHLFIPDPRRGWNCFAYNEAKKLVEQFNPDVVITTGPPHSTHLIGKKLKKRFNIKWVADFRDPWTDIYYYNLLGHSSVSMYIDKKYEKCVLHDADGVVSVSQNLVNLLKSKVIADQNKPFKVIPNGFDPEDFTVRNAPASSDVFRITYLGTIAQQYNPVSFFDTVRDLKENGLPIRLRFVGLVSDEVKGVLNQFGLLPICEFFDAVNHSEVPKFLTESHALLLVIPQTEHDKGILTGKLFEYLASYRPIIAIGPAHGDAAEIINRCRAGKMFSRDDVQGLKEFIKALFNNNIHEPDFDAINLFSRKNQSQQLADFLNAL